MPIRMTDDQVDPNDYYDGGGGGRRPNPGGGGGGGGLLSLLPLLFTLFRRPGGLILLLVLAAAYFFFGRGCGFSAAPEEVNNSGFSTGGRLDPQEFAKAPVYEGLADDIRNPLPEYISLAKFAPERQNQGKQGSCVAWSSAYAAQTILLSSSRGLNPAQTAFSPSYMYNQIGLDGCQGSYIIRAMELMQQKGGVPYNSFPYNENDCSSNPTRDLDVLAQNNRINGYTRLTLAEDPEGLNIRAIKEHLAKDAPVVIGMMVGGSFMQGMLGQKLWQPTRGDYNQMGFGGHAMAVIGYDDKLAGGAFQIMNSWGPEWGENGIGWVRYSDFDQFVREAYGVNPLPKQGAAVNQSFDCEIGLMQVDEKGKSLQYIPLATAGNNTYSSNKVSPGTRFKVEVKNNTECFIYIFGRETDGSSYTLFPYPSKNDPTKTAYTARCGITGYRLFPKFQSLTADNVGNKDFMAVVVSKQELPWYELNQKISQLKVNYVASVSTALQPYGVSRINTGSTGNGNLRFTAPAGTNGVAYAVVEINK